MDTTAGTGFAAFAATRQRMLLRSAWLLTGDWHLAEDLVAVRRTRADRAPAAER